MKGLTLMIHAKFLARLCAVLSIMIVGALAFGIVAVIGSSAHASQISGGKSTPRYAQFHGNFSDVALATKNLKHWSSSFTSDRKSTRLNSSHPSISYAVFCLKKKIQ